MRNPGDARRRSERIDTPRSRPTDACLAGVEPGRAADALWPLATTPGVTGLADSLRPVRTIAAHSLSINSIAFSPAGQRVASGSSNGGIKIWNSKTGERLLFEPETHEGSLRPVSFSPDGRLLASAGVDRAIRLWDLETDRQIRQFDGHERFVEALACSADAEAVAPEAMTRPPGSGMLLRPELRK